MIGFLKLFVLAGIIAGMRWDPLGSVKSGRPHG